MFSKQTISEIAAVARLHGLEPAALLAVADVESGGVAYAAINGRREPLIRFEGHYFDARLSSPDREKARGIGLASPKAGRIANPQTQAGRWRLLDRAAAINTSAAYESTSWGLGQVMGAHWRMLGYASVDEMVDDARFSVSGQARLMARFIIKTGLERALRDRNWRAFARGYNGPAYARNQYDTKMAAACHRYADAIGSPVDAGLLHFGSSGSEVEKLQASLNRHGYDLAVDGIFGRATRSAIVDLQRRHGLPVDGIANPATLKLIETQPSDEVRAKSLIQSLRALFQSER